MKRVFALLAVVVGLALAQVPAYPENTVGVGYGVGRGLILQGSTGLPLSPLGIDTGLDFEAIVPTSFDNLEVWALFKLNLFPALVVADLPLSAGLALDLSYNTQSRLLGLHLGPIASLEIPGGALSGYVGLGYEGGFNLAYGLGGRLYLEPIALEVGLSDRYPLKVALVYLW
ncbi:MAG: bioflim formation protein [Meiothermus sp.]|uniref:bioflim formation protein n=1 Tax=Meiothermus sp. TaxID=1955249 RepID=UPI0025FE613A|nr:bioflim formation protein [Meiothermus sp.]MCS7058280.1 bioflim formation protein [Meiothermus sp.]MCS7193576.1 bioflim formation protein [Meiothermus sp.]MCX7739834.1 bioflim formation protein [Meiothermus sp.]MDW8090589.1 bioflim formation protein [Meiothermus sp.]MDW8480505.1 bioflim formation protein [Meiothermus sp.]